MKTIMIVDKDEQFSNRLRKSLQNEEISILTASSNRHALQQSVDDTKIDLFLIPTHLHGLKKGFFPCKTTDSLSTPVPESDQILSEHSSIEQLKTSIMQNLSEK